MSEYIINDQAIHVEESGRPEAPLAVLIHGWSSSSFTWQTILPMLNQRYHCIAVDLPGFGKSPAPAQTPTIEWYAELIDALIDHFSPHRSALVLGHSMGGQITATLALNHPGKVEQIILLNPSLSGRLSSRVRLLLAPHVYAERNPFIEWLLFNLAKTPLDYTDRLLKPSNFAERAMLSEDHYTHIRRDARRRGQGLTRAYAYRAIREGDLRGKLGKIDIPALVIWGAEDNVVPLRDAGLVAQESSRADLRIIPNAGHWPQFEQTEATLLHIRNFLGLPPLIPGQEPVTNDLAILRETAQFLNNSEIGKNLSESQRLRLASLLHSRSYAPNEEITMMDAHGHEMYVVMDGQLDVIVRNRFGIPVVLASVGLYQVAGELSLLDGSPRSAELRAGSQGVILLTLTREGLLTLAQDDTQMGMQVMQNLAISLGRRLRSQNTRAVKVDQDQQEVRKHTILQA